MKLQSYNDLKRELVEENHAARMFAFYEGRAPDAPVGLGLASGSRKGDFKLAVRTSSLQVLETMKARAAGEIDGRLIYPVARPSADFFQALRRPLEPGAEIAPMGQGWVGTLGCFVRERSTGRIGLLSNAHVLSDMGALPSGTPIVQPFRGPEVARLAADVPVSSAGKNLADAAWAVLTSGTPYLPGFSAAIGHILDPRDVTPDDLHVGARKAGRTTGDTTGRVTAIDIDGLPVAYGQGRVYRFDNQVEFSGGPKSDFSAAGDSGSLIVLEDGHASNLLFAGGNDQTGEDFTYGCPLNVALDALGLELVA